MTGRIRRRSSKCWTPGTLRHDRYPRDTKRRDHGRDDAVLNPMGFAPKVTRKELARAAHPRRQDGVPRRLTLDDSDIFLGRCGPGLPTPARRRRGGQADLQRLPQRRSRHVGGDPGPGPRRHRRGRPLKHLRAGGRRARDDVEATYGVPTVALHTDKFDRVVRSVATVNGMPGLRQVFVPQPIMGKTRVSCAPTSTGGSDHRPAGDAGGGRGADAPVAEARSQARSSRSHHAAARRARHRGASRAALPRPPLDGRAAHRAAHRGARGRDAGRHAPQARRGGGADALHALSRALGVHRREGGRECRDGRGAARLLP